MVAWSRADSLAGRRPAFNLNPTGRSISTMWIKSSPSRLQVVRQLHRRIGGAGAPMANMQRNDSGVTVPAGTSLLVRMIDSVDSDKNHVGDRFRASLEQDLAVDGVVVAPKGADVYGRLAEAKESGHFNVPILSP